jgi:hypothetical protein
MFFLKFCSRPIKPQRKGSWQVIHKLSTAVDNLIAVTFPSVLNSISRGSY